MDGPKAWIWEFIDSISVLNLILSCTLKRCNSVLNVWLFGKLFISLWSITSLKLIFLSNSVFTLVNCAIKFSWYSCILVKISFTLVSIWFTVVCKDSEVFSIVVVSSFNLSEILLYAGALLHFWLPILSDNWDNWSLSAEIASSAQHSDEGGLPELGGPPPPPPPPPLLLPFSNSTLDSLRLIPGEEHTFVKCSFICALSHFLLSSLEFGCGRALM